LKISENKFLRILDSFRDDELGEFRKFVSSPYIASGRNYLPVLNEILRQRASKRNEISLETFIRNYIREKGLALKL